jgi:hypothetical protein
MTVTDAIHAYNVGSLIALTDRQLMELSILLTQKIARLNQVIRSENVAPELKDDLRKYRLVADEIARLMEARQIASESKTKFQRVSSSRFSDDQALSITII